MGDLNTKNNKKKERRKFKMPTAFTILFFIIVFFVLLSWILQWSGVEFTNSKGNKEGVAAAGVVDIFYSILKGFVDKAEIIIFILALGGFVLITMNSKALEALTQGLARKMEKRAIWIIPILVTFFSFCGATYGMAEESLGFYVITIPLMLVAGFDTFTGLMIVLFGAGAGVLASSVNPFVVAVAVDAAGTTDGVANISSSDGMAFRWMAWVLFTIGTIVFIMLYARRVQKNSGKSVTFATLEGDKKFFLGETQEQIPFTKRRIATIVIFLLTFVIMVIYMVGWDSILGGNSFEEAGKWMNDNIPYITRLIPGFGHGYLAEVGTFFFISSLIIAAISWGGEEKFTSDMVDGARDLLGVCLVIATASGVGIILASTGIQELIVSGLQSAVTGLDAIPFILVSYIIFLPLSFLIPSTSGFAAAIFPIWGPLAASIGGGASAGSLAAFSFSSGLLNLFTPTSGVVMGALAIARINYGTLFKGAWMYFVGAALLSIALLSVGPLLGTAVFGN